MLMMVNNFKFEFKCVLIAFMLIFIGTVGPTVTPAESSGNVNFLLGVKNLEDSDWEPLEQQPEFGIDFDFAAAGSPISFTFGLLTSSDEENVEGFDFEGRTSELYLGIKTIFGQHSNVHPYLGLGISSIYAEIEGSQFGVSVSDDDSALGFWLSGGVFVTLNEHLNLGVNLRFSNAEVSLFGVDGEAGGFHTHVFIGYHW